VVHAPEIAHLQPHLPREFALAVACCRWAYSGEGADPIGELAGIVDWGAFLATCRRHRVQGLAWHALSKLDVGLPAPVQVALAGEARAIADQGLRAANESGRLALAFAGAKIPLLFLKGLTVGKLAYANPFVKMGWDIDLLIAPHDLSRAAAVLGELGYVLSIPSDPGRLAHWHRSWKESIWPGADGTIVELHTRVADQPELLPAVSVSSPQQKVRVASGIDLPTLADEELFAYLCVHGASSAWFRLKWLADLAGFLHRRQPQSIDSLFERSQQLGAGRSAAQALLLARKLFALSLSPALAARLQSRINGWLARTALAEMLRGEPAERALGTRNIHLTQFFLLDGARYKLSELKRQIRHAIDML
jgi:hypothetical protein